jgi:alpha-glucosidase
MTKPWWKAAVIYQIYPRSVQDSNRDGVRDLPGIIRRLPYLAELGVDPLWISPIFASPMADFGYDISDYTAIAAVFGGMADFDALLARAHRHGLKLILDFVPNHTSDRHPWFVESRASRTASRRDWYIWRNPAPGGGAALIDEYEAALPLGRSPNWVLRNHDRPASPAGSGPAKPASPPCCF